MRSKIFGFVVAGMLLAAAPVSAMVLSVAGGVDDTVPVNFDPVGFPGGVSVGDPIKVFNSGTPGGLALSGPAVLKYEYYGKEADFVNFFVGGGDLFSTATSAVGDTIVAPTAGGTVPFSFITSSGGGLIATNGGPIDLGLSIAFADLGGGSFLIMFNDIGHDVDRDDLVVRVSVSQVPVPAAVWLLLSAVAGLLGLSRVIRKGAPSAA